MAKGKTSPDSTSSKPAYAMRFVPGALTTEQKAQCKAWKQGDENLGPMNVDMIANGYKLSLMSDSQGPGYLCIIQPKDKEHRHYGWMLSGRGSTPEKALKQALFRHYVIFDGDWPMDPNQLSSEDYDD